MRIELKQAMPPPATRLKQLLARLGRVRAAVAGDLALDAYWQADMTRSELSLETPPFPLPVMQERYAPGAGGNVAANLAALDLAHVQAISVLGHDWRGWLLQDELGRRKVDTGALLSSADRVTNAYIKPYRQGVSDLAYEDPRLDFANYSRLPDELDQAMADQLAELAGDLDVLCLADQFQQGSLADKAVQAAVSLARAGLPVLADSRYRIEQFAGCLLKPNALECARALGRSIPEQASLLQLAEMAAELAGRTGSQVCLTAGPDGCLLAGSRSGQVRHVPALPVLGPLRICGPVDTFLATFSASIGAGASNEEAAFLANAASAVTIKKINQTGTASPAEIRAVLTGAGYA